MGEPWDMDRMISTGGRPVDVWNRPSPGPSNPIPPGTASAPGPWVNWVLILAMLGKRIGILPSIGPRIVVSSGSPYVAIFLTTGQGPDILGWGRIPVGLGKPGVLSHGWRSPPGRISYCC